ncbi:MAG TPA: response regulator [Thermoanaerobaculia bacterium]|nr:response regulator [Thermoanaerobaculia bacterium]
MTHILLVEDNQDDVDLTLLAFRRANIVNEVRVAHDGVAALEILHGKPGELPPKLPAVVLLDLKLPRVDGFEVLSSIRQHPHTRLLPVVVLTSSAQERDVVQTYSCGANSYIVKPVDFEQFLVAAQQIGMYWLMLNAKAPEDSDAHPVR